MQTVKYCMLFLIFISSCMIGKFISKKYVYRLEELEEIKNALNILKTKIKFTYEPLSNIFEEIAKNTSQNVSNIFIKANEKMKINSASNSWKQAIEESTNNLNDEDKSAISMLSNLLGQTDVEGQLGQIEVTQNFLDAQILQAQEEKQKNEKLYSRLGTTIGLAIVIILI